MLERARLIAIVASNDARGARGGHRTALLLARLGLAGRSLGIVVTRAPQSACRAGDGGADGNAVARVREVGLARVSRQEQGLAPPSGAFSGLVALDGVPVA